MIYRKGKEKTEEPMCYELQYDLRSALKKMKFTDTLFEIPSDEMSVLLGISEKSPAELANNRLSMLSNYSVVATQTVPES